MTAAEFEEQYARNSRIPVAELHFQGRYAQPCRCGYPECQGWEMGHQHEEAILKDRALARRGLPVRRPPGDHGAVP